MDKLKNTAVVLAALLWTAASPAVAVAQTSASQIGGLRAYWHVFIAYAIAIALVLGWVLSISRRLKEVEERLSQ